MKTMRKGRTRLLAALVALACAAALAAGAMLSGCSSSGSQDGGQQAAQEQTRTFTDSLGREVQVPVDIERIAPSGHTANQVLLTMAPERMVGLSQDLTDYQKKVFAGKVSDDLPVFGAAFGAKGDLNKEAVANSGAQIMIDTGEPKKGLSDDLDQLQDELGIPVVFINTPLDGWGDAYRMLGDLLGEQDRGNELGDYCDNAYQQVSGVMDSIPSDQRVKMAYLLGNDGLNAIAQGSYQGTVIDMCADNVVVLDKASGSGNGNEISMEQLAQWNPQMIVFGSGNASSDEFFDNVGSDPAWTSLSAIADGNYYRAPQQPWNWLNSPPTVNQVLGMQWLARVCYPSHFDNDMQQMVTEYFHEFYGYDLSQSEYDQLMDGALPKA